MRLKCVVFRRENIYCCLAEDCLAISVQTEISQPLLSGFCLSKLLIHLASSTLVVFLSKVIFNRSVYLISHVSSDKMIFVCLVQMPALGSSLTAVDPGLLSTLLQGQVSLSLFLSSLNEDTVAGTGVILPYSSTGTSS